MLRELLPAVEADASRCLDKPIRLASATVPLVPNDLTSDDAERWHRLPQGPRRQEWLLGRAALRELGARVPQVDTLRPAFPHPHLSLTHAAGAAVAAWVDTTADAAVRGLGVDLEPPRPCIDRRVGRLFLSRPEQRFVERVGASTRGDVLLRLWVVKEALFKANPANAGTLVPHYSSRDPEAISGSAVGPCPTGTTLRYVSCRVAGGHLAVALCLSREMDRCG